MNLILFVFFYCTSIIMVIDLLADTDILLMIKRVIRVGMCHITHRYAKANNAYIWEVNNFYSWEMLQNFPVNRFK